MINQSEKIQCYLCHTTFTRAEWQPCNTVALDHYYDPDGGCWSLRRLICSLCATKQSEVDKVLEGLK